MQQVEQAWFTIYWAALMLPQKKQATPKGIIYYKERKKNQSVSWGEVEYSNTISTPQTYCTQTRRINAAVKRKSH